MLRKVTLDVFSLSSKLIHMTRIKHVKALFSTLGSNGSIFITFLVYAAQQNILSVHILNQQTENPLPT